MAFYNEHKCFMVERSFVLKLDYLIIVQEYKINYKVLHHIIDVYFLLNKTDLDVLIYLLDSLYILGIS